jgi:hypothetical protein
MQLAHYLLAMIGVGLAMPQNAVRKTAVAAAGTPTGDGVMDFSLAGGDDTALLALLEDI